MTRMKTHTLGFIFTPSFQDVLLIFIMTGIECVRVRARHELHPSKIYPSIRAPHAPC